MALTPIDVQQKTFGTALRGYDLDEVDDFLDEVVTSLKGYEQRLADAQERIAALEGEVASKGDAESAISRALVAAQRSADGIVADAKTEAERILGDAGAERDRVMEQSLAEAEEMATVRAAERARLETEVRALRAAVHELRDKVRGLVGSIESDLDSMDEELDETERTHLGAAAVTGMAVVDESDIDEAVAGGEEPGEIATHPEAAAEEGPGEEGPGEDAGGEESWSADDDLDIALDIDEPGEGEPAAEVESGADWSPADLTAASEPDLVDQIVEDAPEQGSLAGQIELEDWVTEGPEVAGEEPSDEEVAADLDELVDRQGERHRRPWE